MKKATIHLIYLLIIGGLAYYCVELNSQTEACTKEALKSRIMAQKSAEEAQHQALLAKQQVERAEQAAARAVEEAHRANKLAEKLAECKK